MTSCVLEPVALFSIIQWYTRSPI